jgi:exosortase A-associated hydrolase 2
MNLSRAVIARHAQYFATHGYTTCTLDYYGTGDSEGEIDEADSQLWLQDILAAIRWLQSRGVERIVPWGVRFGALLLLHFQRELHAATSFDRQLLWAPVTSGKLFSKQFLRLKQASAMLRNDGAKVDWRQRIRDGETVEIAGYPINETLLSSLEQLLVPGDFRPAAFTCWQELGTAEPGPAVQRVVAQWPASSYRLAATATPAFWQTPETFTLPELYPVTRALLEG